MEWTGTQASWKGRGKDEEAYDRVVQNTYLALALLFLELEGDAADGALGDTLHEVSGESGNLVAQPLGRHNGHLIEDSLVRVEVIAVQFRVVLLDEHTRRALGSLGANTTHLDVLSWEAEGLPRPTWTMQDGWAVGG